MSAHFEPLLDLDDFITPSMQARLEHAADAIRIAITATEQAAEEAERVSHHGGSATEWRCLEALEQLDEALGAVESKQPRRAGPNSRGFKSAGG